MATLAQAIGFGAVSSRPEPGVEARLWSDGDTVWRDSGLAWEVYMRSAPPATQSWTANEVGYNDTVTALGSTNVQGAIEALVTLTAGFVGAAGTLTANRLVVGAGGSDVNVLGSLGTTTQVLHGNAAGAPTWGAVALGADVSGTLPATNGGTGFATLVIGDLLYASTTSAWSKLAIGSTGQVLKVAGGVPTWAAESGLSNPLTTTGDIIYSSSGSTAARLGIGTTAQALIVTGGVPVWGTVGPTGGGTGIATYTTGDILYASASNVLSKLAVGTNGHVLTLAAGVPTWAAGGGGGSGTVNSGLDKKFAYYNGAGTTLDDFDGTVQLSIGTPSSTAATGSVAFYSDTEANTSMQLRGGNVNPNIYITRSRGTIASPTALLSGDTMGRIMFGGYSGAAWQEIYNGLKFVTNENWNGGALGAQFVVMATIPGTTTREDCFGVAVDANYTYLTGSKSLMVSSTNQGLRVNSSNSTLAYVSLTFAGTQKATFGVGGSNDDWITGSILDDANIRNHASKSINFSTDNGASIAGRFVASTGQFVLNKNITSNSTTTGTLVVTGGFGLSENANIGGTLGVTGIATLGVVKVTSAIRDTNNNNLIVPSATGSAVNNLTVANAATGNGPTISATGSDTNISLNLQPKGSGTVIIGHPSGTGNCAFITDANVPYIRWRATTTTKTITGLAASNDNIITGSVTDDFCFRQDANKSFIFSTNASSTIDFAILGNSGGFKFITPSGTISDAWKFGNANVVSPTSPNRTVTISIAGTTLYLAAKTTND